MPLCTPTLVGPILEWSSTLLVEGCVHRATVTVRSIGPSRRDIAKAAKVGGGRDRISLLPGVKLQANDLLVLKQESAVGVSPETNEKLAYSVAPAPTNATDLPPLSFVSHIFECGAALWIEGAVPGAEVTVKSTASTTIAKGIATEDCTRLMLSGPMPSAGDTVSISQAAPPGWPPLSGTAKVTTFMVDHIPTPHGQPLQTPVFAGDHQPQGCDTSVRIGHIIDGATVTIKHSRGLPDDRATFDLSELTFILASPLPKQGELLEVTQALVGKVCEREHLTSNPLRIKVNRSQPLDRPAVLPLCPGVIQVAVTHLDPGATVTISVNGVSFLGTAPADKTSATFEVDPIPADAIVDVIQHNRCGQGSGKTPVPVKPLGPSKPTLAEPLLACARVVRVEHTQPGAYLQVFAQTGSAAPRPISPRVTALVNSVRIDVTPNLIENDFIFVRQLACSGDWEDSHGVTAEAAPSKKLRIPFPVEGDDYVIVDGLPGAHVDIFTTSKDGSTKMFLGDNDIDPVIQRIGLSRALTLGDNLSGIQNLCSITKKSGRLVDVLPSSRTFTLSAPISRESTTTAHQPLVWDRGSLECHHNGEWTLTAHIVNKETDADVEFTFNAKLAFTDAAGNQLVVSKVAQLSATGSGEVTKVGYRTHGIPPEYTFNIQGNYDPFRDPNYWSNILETTAAFDLPVKWVIWNYWAGTPEEPDGPPE